MYGCIDSRPMRACANCACVRMCDCKARQRAIVDEASGTFVNTKTGEKMVLSDAVEAGHVIAEFEPDVASSSHESSANEETKTYAVCAVVDQVRIVNRVLFIYPLGDEMPPKYGKQVERSIRIMLLELCDVLSFHRLQG